MIDPPPHVTLEGIQRIIDESRLWKEGRGESHKFVLSPAIYQFEHDEIRQLHLLGESLYKVMRQLNTLITYSENQRVAKGKTWNVIRKVSTIGIPHYHRRLQTQFPDHYPILFKVDLLRSQGKFWIAELDGANTHGFGYTTLLNRIRDRILEDRGSTSPQRLPGLVPTIAEYLKHTNHDPRLFMVMSGNSRFYDIYYQILQHDLTARGVNVELVGEWMLNHEKYFSESERIALQFPMFRNNSPLIETFLRRYEAKELSFLIPPKLFMSSKAIMALLKNSHGDQELEEILRAFIARADLEQFRSFIPESHLIYPDMTWKLSADLYTRPWVVKQAISSGSKNVHFTDGVLADGLLKNPYQTILQEEIVNDGFHFPYYDDAGKLHNNETVDNSPTPWFARFTAHFHFSELVEIDITARQDTLVHGAKDCLMFSAILP